MIQNEIRSAKNRVRHGMNGALIAIGGRGDSLELRALEVAGKIGEVVVDHGDTDCKTPDASSYIQCGAIKDLGVPGTPLQAGLVGSQFIAPEDLGLAASLRAPINRAPTASGIGTDRILIAPHCSYIRKIRERAASRA